MSLRNRLVVPPLALALCLTLCACGSSPAEEADTTPSTETIEQTTTEAQSEPEPEPETETEPAQPAVTTMRVGEAGKGFVDVPSDFVRFTDVAGGTDLQYSDATGTSIVTLNSFDISSVPEDMRDSFSAYDAAQSVYYNIESSEDNPLEVEGATVTLAGREAYQIYAYYEDGAFLVSWVLDDDAGGIRYVSAEGPGDTIMSLVSLVEDTYDFDK